MILRRFRRLRAISCRLLLVRALSLASRSSSCSGFCSSPVLSSCIPECFPSAFLLSPLEFLRLFLLSVNGYPLQASHFLRIHLVNLPDHTMPDWPTVSIIITQIRSLRNIRAPGTPVYALMTVLFVCCFRLAFRNTTGCLHAQLKACKIRRLRPAFRITIRRICHTDPTKISDAP